MPLLSSILSQSAEVVSTWAGLRPGRSRVRLEREEMVIGGKKKKVGYFKEFFSQALGKLLKMNVRKAKTLPTRI